MKGFEGLIGGIIFLSFGLLSIFLSKFLGQKSADFANRQPKWMRWGIQSNPVYHRLAFVGVGAIFVLWALKQLIGFFG
jgi:hypothetical protein